MKIVLFDFLNNSICLVIYVLLVDFEALFVGFSMQLRAIAVNMAAKLLSKKFVKIKYPGFLNLVKDTKMEFKQKEREQVLKALSNSTRRVILKQIVTRRGATYTELMELLSLNPDLESGGFNYHLKELTVAGLLERTNGFYRITDLGEKALVEGVDGVYDSMPQIVKF